MIAPRPTPPTGTELGAGRRRRPLGLDPRQAAIAVVVAVVAALAVAFFVLRELDLRGGPAIVIEDPRTDATIVVEVGGEVATPGVFDLPHGARVDDALARAGGTDADADLSGLNLARRLDDGERLIVPGFQPTPADAQPEGLVSTIEAPAPTATAALAMGVTSGESPNRLIDINAATAAELERLPEIGATRAAAIVAYREANGPFTTVDELANVDGISERIVAILRPLVTVGQ